MEQLLKMNIIFQHNFLKKFMRQKSKSIVLNISQKEISQESNRWEWMQSESLFRISSLTTESPLSDVSKNLTKHLTGLKYGLQILIDLHTAPDSQNGFDNGGISGVCKWSQDPDEVEFELTVLERLAKRYGTRKGLWGIEILNEPILEDMWESMNVAERYPAVDPEKAKGTKPNTMEFIRGFYLEAYDRIRKHMPEEKYVVFHDAFRLKAWKDFMREEKYKNVVLDTHQYLMVAEMNGCEQNVENYVSYVEELKKDIAEMQEYFPVICGEWCLFNSLAVGHDTKGGQTVLNGVEGLSEECISAETKKEIYNTLAKAMLDAWDAGSGYFYWSYKLLTDTVNTPGWVGWDSWDLGRCVDFGWFPIEK